MHFRFSNTNDKDFAAEFDRVDGAVDGGFDARAFERDGGLDAAGEGDDVGCGVFDTDAAFDFVGAHAGDEFFGIVEPALVDVCDDDWFCAGGGGAEEGDEANGAGAADEGWVAEAETGAFDAGEGDGEGFEEGAVFKGHASDFVAPHCGVGDVAAEEAVNGWGGKETHVDTAVVAACQAVFAFVADEVGFDCDAVADFEVGDGGVGGNYYSSRLMA